MEPVLEFSVLSAAITAHLRPGVDTNCTLKAEAMRQEITAGTLFSHSWAGGLLLLRKRPTHYLLNYYRTTPEVPLDIPLPTPVVVELPLRPGREAALSWWEAQGFQPALRRVRLARSPLSPECAIPSQEPSMTMDQAMALLRSCFDPFTGCLPTPWELEEDFRQNRLLTAGDQGILRFSGGRTAELRHLAVAQASRGRGIGRDLVARFNVCTAGRRALVWTGADNTAALHLYETAGFRPDGWSSLVLIQA